MLPDVEIDEDLFYEQRDPDDYEDDNYRWWKNQIDD